ncbi:MAG: glycosyl hydrolase 2 galactose-binding domain-containing protein [Ornithinibacter sp.]
MTSTGVPPMVRTSRALDTDWTVRAAGGPAPDPIRDAVVAAVVPGVVHLDLMRAGLVPDPYLDDNEALLAWVGLVDWTYECPLVLTEHDLAAAQRHELVFDGLDTVAAVLLDGEVVAEVANQHRQYRLDVTERLRAGENRLTVAFRSPVRYANAQSAALGARPRPYPLPYEAIRKSACSFGWDWGIATFTSGIWRPASLTSWSIARLDEVRVHAEPHGSGGRVRANVRVARAGTTDLTVTLDVAGTTASAVLPGGHEEVTLTVELDSVDRWWPAGHGDQPLYDVQVGLAAGDDLLDTTSRRVGFRTLRWDTEPDAAGTPFQLVVNDRPVFVKGVNWIPDDAFPSRLDRARYAARLTQATAANVNLVRVWGGGIYESDDFYDLCDELGLLTWQDFLFACAAYPEEEPIRGEVEAEARHQVARLAHHASLALFCGNNENLWGHEDWGWKERLDGRTWGALYYHRLLPGIVDELAPHVPYVPGSPFSPHGQHPNDESHGAMHLWEQWNSLDWTTYREVRPRFVAEFGWQGPPAWSTLTRAVTDDPLTPESPGMIVHQKALDGNVKLTSGLLPHYRVPDDMETWHWAMQLNQATAVASALDWFRSLAPHTSGAVVWQLNDCWPVTSWAAVDGDGREKPLYFALRQAFAPRVVTVQPAGDGLLAVLGNDTDDAWEGEVVLTRRGFDGAVRATARMPVTVAPRSSASLEVPPPVAAFEHPAGELVVAEGLGTRGLWFPAKPRHSELPPPAARVEVGVVEGTAEESVTEVTVTAQVLLRDVTLLVDKLHPGATVDRGMITLLPGESATFTVTGAHGIPAERFSDPTVLRSGNQLVTPPAPPERA